MTAQNNAQANLTGSSRTGLELFSLVILHGSSTYQTRLNWTELFKLNSLVSISVDLGEFACRPGAERIRIEGVPCFVFLFALPVSLCHPHNSLLLCSRRAALQSRQRLLPSLVPICWVLQRQKKGRRIFFHFDIFSTQRQPLMRGITELFFNRSPENPPMCTFLF